MILRTMLALVYATGRASHARQVKGDDPDKKGYLGPPSWGFGMGLTTPHSKKLIVTKVEQRNKLDRCNDGGWKRTRYTEITVATTWKNERSNGRDRQSKCGCRCCARNSLAGTKRKTQERIERRSGKRSLSVGSEKMERVGDR
jgi:hypothetical protein